MMKKDNLYHAINVNKDYYDQELTIKKLDKILDSGALLSRRLQGDLDSSRGGFSGFDYICLYDNLLRNAGCFNGDNFYKGNDSYTVFMSNSLALGFSRDNISIIKPTLIAPVSFDWNKMEEMRIIARLEGARYTDMPDEVQVKDKLSLKKMVCLTLPVHLMLESTLSVNNYLKNDIYNCVTEIENLLRTYGYDVPIYDLFSRIKLDSLEKVEKVYRKYKD